MRCVYVGLLFALLTAVNSAIRHDHLTMMCNADISTTIEGRLEASTELTYENNMNCVFHVMAPLNKQLLLLFSWFDLEQKVYGVCVDYLNVHDGDNVTTSTLNTQPLCGNQRSLGNMTSSGRHMTFHFVTDVDAVYRGFDLTYIVFSYAPCGSSDFACSNSLCIDSSLRCDDVTQCGDGSDETDELCALIPNTLNGVLSMGAIVGIASAGLVLMIVAIVAIHKVVDCYQWQKWLRQNDLEGNPWDEEELYHYPITKRYHTKVKPHRDDVTAADNAPAQTEPVQEVMMPRGPVSGASGTVALGDGTKWPVEKAMDKTLVLSSGDVFGGMPYSSDA